MKYLGRTVTFEQQETIEIKNRIRFARSSFAKHRQEFSSRSYILRHRLRLLDAVITPSMLYCAGTWTFTPEHEKMIRSRQRKMLRPVVQTRRKCKSKDRKDSEEKHKTDDDRSNVCFRCVWCPRVANGRHASSVRCCVCPGSCRFLCARMLSACSTTVCCLGVLSDA